MRKWLADLNEKKRIKKYIARCRLLAVAASTYVLQQNITRDSRAALAAVRLKERNAETEKRIVEDRVIENKNKIEIKHMIIEMIEIINMEFEDPRSITQKSNIQRKETNATMTADSIFQNNKSSWIPGYKISKDYLKNKSKVLSNISELIIEDTDYNNEDNNIINFVITISLIAITLIINFVIIFIVDRKSVV